MGKTKKTRNKGFTLIEVIVALFIVGIVLSAITATIININILNKKIEYRSHAYKILDSKIESLRAGAFDDIPTAPVSNFAISPGELPAAQGTVYVSEVEGGSGLNSIKKVDVKVSWNYKESKNIYASTYIARKGLAR